MKKIEIELFTEPTNNAVVRLPARRFPGVLVQGDTLWTLHQLAASLLRHATKQGDEAMRDDASELEAKLGEMVRGYERALSEHGIELPYVK